MAKNKKRPAQVPRTRSIPSFPATSLWPDALNVTVLAGLAIYFASVSWLKWPDPLVDFGRELYLPWRITQGAVIFKDEAALYGPLSPYLNSLFFRVGGVSLMTLVIANALIYSAILGLLYYLMRVGWGRWAAFASSAFFIGVFSFSHLVGFDNYNFLTPYSHEMTHGILLVLCLVLVLKKAVRSLSAVSVAAAGLLAGLSVLLKLEIVVVVVAVMTGALFLVVRQDFRNPPWGRWIRAAGIFLVMSLTPMIVVSLLYSLRAGFSLIDSLHRANYAWVSAFENTGLLKDPFQLAALGLDHPWQKLGVEILWGGAGVVFAAGLAWGTAFFGRTARLQRVALCMLLVAAGAAATQVPWMDAGYALPGILLCGALIEIARMFRAGAAGEKADASLDVRVLIWMAAAAMLTRMALNPRIYHYGFAQAALAGIVSVAILLSSIPQFLSIDGIARKSYQALMTLLVGAIVWVVASTSMKFYSYHTLEIGEGADQFYGFDQNVSPTGLLVEQAREYLERDARENNVHSLLVMPEGVMLNYLTRIPNSIPYYFFPPFIITQRGDDIMSRINTSPPDRIVVISRDMREFGVGRFGDSPDHGQHLIDFINQHYQGVYSYGYNDPLDPDQFGFLVFAHKN